MAGTHRYRCMLTHAWAHISTYGEKDCDRIHFCIVHKEAKRNENQQDVDVAANDHILDGHKIAGWSKAAGDVIVFIFV
eukprot:scaffold394524_cov53-Prasinocladus_malaysianus.AAC.1